jgi:hypothetical protein
MNFERSMRSAVAMNATNLGTKKKSRGVLIKSGASKKLNEVGWFVADGKRVRRRLCTMVEEVVFVLRPGVKIVPMPSARPPEDE